MASSTQDMRETRERRSIAPTTSVWAKSSASLSIRSAVLAACGFPHRTQSQINFTPPSPAPGLGHDRCERGLADLKRITHSAHPGRTVPRAEACAFVRAQSEIAPLIANGRARSRHSADVRANRRMIALNLGSCTFSAASFAETHFTSRWRRSGHCLFWRLTFSGKTCTSQSTTRPFLKRFSYANDPRGCLRTAPTTPASSNASRAAE
jgi:hypothetical protein